LFAIAVRADQPRLAAALNRALDQLEADGTLGAIIDRYL
jgi:ABC-type amino acid transport substrate-binding protein